MRAEKNVWCLVWYIASDAHQFPPLNSHLFITLLRCMNQNEFWWWRRYIFEALKNHASKVFPSHLNFVLTVVIIKFEGPYKWVIPHLHPSHMLPVCTCMIEPPRQFSSKSTLINHALVHCKMREEKEGHFWLLSIFIMICWSWIPQQ